MTANIELTPLPEPWQCETRMCPALYTAEQVRACVAHATAARDAEVEALREALHYANGTAELAMKHRDAAEARAELLAESLRDLLSWFPEKPAPSEWRICAGEQGADDAIEYARAAINPTAAQENDDA